MERLAHPMPIDTSSGREFQRAPLAPLAEHGEQPLIECV
jgi:hypothetical protein